MYQKLEHFLTKEFANLKEVVFLKVDDCYQLFNRYSINKNTQGEFVLHIDNRNDIYTFNNLQHAVVWCIYDKQSKYVDIKKIHYLDNKLGSLETSIQLYKRLLSQAKNNDDRDLYLIKLNENSIKKKQAQREMNTYIRLSKIWQNKKFLEKQPK